MTRPPRTAELLLESLGASPRLREPLLGDLTEEFAVRAERDGVDAARRWYHREALRAAPHLLWDAIGSLRGREVWRIAGIVFASYCFAAMLAFVASMMAGAVMQTFGIAAGRFSNPSDWLFYLGFVLGAACTTTGGAIAAWLDTRTPLVSALALGVAWSIASFVSLTMGQSGAPGWFRFVAPLAIVAGTMVGGVLRVRALRAPEGAQPSTE
jgi:hypothetical protein